MEFLNSECDFDELRLPGEETLWQLLDVRNSLGIGVQGSLRCQQAKLCDLGLPNFIGNMEGDDIVRAASVRCLEAMFSNISWLSRNFW